MIRTNYLFPKSDEPSGQAVMQLNLGCTVLATEPRVYRPATEPSSVPSCNWT